MLSMLHKKRFSPFSVWFPTLIYNGPLAGRDSKVLQRELELECRQVQEFDRAGKAWSKENYPDGYTSYGSMDKMHRVSSTFARLESLLGRHVKAFAKRLEWDLGQGTLKMSDCWINIMSPGATHGLHLHPLGVVSGTYYVKTPRGSAGLKFEDPRLSRLMAAPPRTAGSGFPNWTHVTYPARAGSLILFESWLRHEVPRSRIRGERISISFNYHWV
jgi:uncharacterized protein (TIGR02466 family)